MRRPWPEGARCLPVRGAAPGARGSETGGGDSTPGSGGGQSPRHHHAESQARKRESTLPQADTDTGEPGRGQATWVRPRGKEGRANGTGVSSASRQAAGLLSRQVTGLRPQAPSSEAASVPKGRGPGSKGLGRGRSCHWGLGPPGENRQPRPADRPRRSQHPPLTAPPVSPGPHRGPARPLSDSGAGVRGAQNLPPCGRSRDRGDEDQRFTFERSCRVEQPSAYSLTECPREAAGRRPHCPSFPLCPRGQRPGPCPPP